MILSSGFGGGHTALLSYEATKSLFMQARFSDGRLQFSLPTTVGGSMEFGAFVKIVRSMEYKLHVRFDFRHRENSALNLKMLLD